MNDISKDVLVKIPAADLCKFMTEWAREFDAEKLPLFEGNEEYIEKGQELRKTLQDPNCIKNYRKTLKAIEEEALEQMKGFGEQFFGLLEEHNLSVDDLNRKKTGIASYFNKLMNGNTSDEIRNQTVEKHLEDAERGLREQYKDKIDNYFETFTFNHGTAASKGAQYILKSLVEKKKNKKD